MKVKIQKTKTNKVYIYLRNNKLAFLFGIILVSVFFYRLFFIVPSIYYTPDFGRSDIWHQNYPFKEILSQNLKAFNLPLWNKDLGGGFPLLAEGQVGTFFIYNTLAYFIFPTWVAWNLTYPLTFFIMFLGMYLFAKEQKISKYGSIFGSTVFSFSAYHILQIPHINLIQAVSILPWMMLLTQKFIIKPKLIYLLLLSLFISQQIFLVCYQITLISLLAVVSFSFLSLYKKKVFEYKKFVLILLSILFAFSLSSAQLMPSFELMQNSPSAAGSDEVFRFPLPIQHLLSYISPNHFGSSKLGTYPEFNKDWGLYWENTHYLGIIPLLLILFRFINIKKSKIHKSEKIFLFFIFIFTVLALGKNTPASFLFSFPPLTIFRVPARFLILTTFSLSILTASSFDFFMEKINKKFGKNHITKIVFLIFIISIFDLFNFGYNYHPLVKVSEALAPPKILTNIPPRSRYYSYPDQYLNWNLTFNTVGWQEIKPYLYFKNALSPDSNILWNLPSLTVYSGLRPSRLQVLENYYLSDSMVNLYGAEFIISPTPQSQTHYNLITKIEPPSQELKPFYLYKNLMALPRFRFASNVVNSKSIEESAQTLLISTEKDWTNSVLLESAINQNFKQPINSEIKLITDTQTKLELNVSTDQDTVLVIADSFYPGWIATIDGKISEIIPANLNNRALIVPKGSREIVMRYLPKMFYVGAVLSIFAHILLSTILLSRKLQKTLTNKLKLL